ncbi:MAG: hypothetical protein QOK15_956 [Nocardioidaceae bacterium]|jgi:hypothetical protein|nr:hypothetical protein [Nocardioidaceae bacterium]
MRIPTRIAAMATLTMISAATALPAMPALAQGGNDVTRHGSCSGQTTWKLKAGPDDGRIEVEAEIDSNKAGQTWNWRLTHNGSLSAKGSATTAGASGSFTVRRTVTNLAGDDTLRFRAVNPRTDEVCNGRVVV